jgi:hypothetical protein
VLLGWKQVEVKRASRRRRRSFNRCVGRNGRGQKKGNLEEKIVRLRRGIEGRPSLRIGEDALQKCSSIEQPLPSPVVAVVALCVES